MAVTPEGTSREAIAMKPLPTKNIKQPTRAESSHCLRVGSAAPRRRRISVEHRAGEQKTQTIGQQWRKADDHEAQREVGRAPDQVDGR